MSLLEENGYKGEKAMDPLNLTGPQFLGFFAIAFVVAMVIAAVLKRALRGGGGVPPREVMNLDPLEIAYLAGGTRLAINAAVAGLYQSGMLRVDKSTRKVNALGNLPSNSSPFVRDVHASFRESALVGTAHKKLSTEMLTPRMEKMGLVVDPGRRSVIRLAAACPLLIVLILGVMKIAVGISRDKPVVFLLFMLFAAFIVTLVIVAKVPWRTSMGDRVIDDLRRKHDALQQTAKADPRGLAPSDLIMAVGLFGPIVLAGTAMADVHRAIVPPGASGSGGSSCSSSCGSSSCSGGSSCGGGSGCGGCGGGGGD